MIKNRGVNRLLSIVIIMVFLLQMVPLGAIAMELTSGISNTDSETREETNEPETDADSPEEPGNAEGAGNTEEPGSTEEPIGCDCDELGIICQCGEDVISSNEALANATGATNTLNAAASTVTFYVDGEIWAVLNTDGNGFVAKPESPEKLPHYDASTETFFRGLDFAFWAGENGLPFDFGSEISEDISLYAKFTATVKFEVDGVEFYSVTVNEGDTVYKPAADPTKDGHTFVMWWSGDHGQFVFNASGESALTVKEHTTLTARFKSDASNEYDRYAGYWLMTPGQPGVSISGFRCSDGKGGGCNGTRFSSFLMYFTAGATDTSESGPLKYIVVTCECGRTSEWEATSNQGATIYKNGTHAKGGLNNIQMGNQIFRAFTVKVTFRSGTGGVLNNDQTEIVYIVDLKSDWNNGWEPTVWPNPGNFFRWWHVEGRGDFFSHELEELGPVMTDLVLIAQYTSKPVITVTFDPNGGNPPSFSSKEVDYGLAYGALATTGRTGYQFLGWYTTATGGVKIMESTIVTTPVNHTLYARWVEDPDVTINYLATTGGTVSLASESLAPATGVAQGSTAAVAAGYSFVNWTNAAGTEVSTDLTFIPGKVGGLNVAATYTANFVENPNVTINYVATTGGSVTRASESLAPATGVAEGSTAEAALGYMFVNWTNADGIVLTEAVTLIPAKVGGLNVAATYTANFVIDPDQTYTITYIANTGGSVEPAFETHQILFTGANGGSIAEAAPGYSFVNWTSDPTGVTQVSGEAKFVPTAKVSVTFYANFVENPDVTINYVATTGGSVSPASESLAPATGVAQGSTAAAAVGYRFVNWTNEAGTEVGADLSFVPEKVDGVNVAATYTANFVEDEDIVINYQATTGGSVSRASESLAPATGVAQGSTAAASTGYRFVNWTDEAGTEVGTDLKFVPAKVGGLNVAATYTANFEIDPDQTYTITYVANAGGIVDPTSETHQILYAGDNDGSTATAELGYKFVNWTIDQAGVTQVSGDANFVPTAKTSVTFYANFEIDDRQTYTISYVANNGGSVDPTSETHQILFAGANDGSTATPTPGYSFVYWTSDAAGLSVVSSSASFVPAIHADATFYANFVENDNITINYVAATGGTVSLASESLAPATGVAQGSTAARAPGYSFLSWTNEAGDVVGTSLTFVPEKVGGLNVAATYTANFVENEDIVINYKATTGGSASPASESLAPATGVAQGSTAAASIGYRFVNWTDEAGGVVGTDPVFVPEKVGGLNVAATYTANFAIDDGQTYTINYIANNGGSVAPASETHQILFVGDNSGSKATAALGYRFVNWTVDQSGVTQVSGDAHYVPTARTSVTFYANFEIDPDQTYTINYVANNGGSVDPESETHQILYMGANSGSTATAALGYKFVNWTSDAAGQTVVSASASFVPAANADATFYANFAIDDGQTYTINYIANNGGSVSPASETHQILFTGANNGSTATPTPGYSFVSWTSDAAGQSVVSTSANFVPAANADATFYANFAENDNITINYVAATGGSVSRASESLAPATGVALGSIATEAAGYSFVNWTNEDGAVVSTSLSFVPDKVGGVNVAATYTANFVENGNIAINYIAAPGGSVSLSFESLAPATGVAQGSTAAAALGYRFVNWTNEAGGVVSTDLKLVPEKVGGLNVAATYTANFVIDDGQTYTIYYVANIGGSVSLTFETHQILFAGANSGSTATAASGYRFVNWTADQTGVNQVSGNANFVPTARSSVTFYANFEIDPDQTYTINYFANIGGSVDPASETHQILFTGANNGSTATAAPGYSFVSWTSDAAGQNVVSASANFVPPQNADAAFYANFVENENITINYVATTGGSVSRASESLAPATGVAQGSIATAVAGYSFVNWTNADGAIVGTSLSFVPAKVGGVNVAATYTANFIENPNVTINYAATTGGSVSRASESLAPATGVAQGSTAAAATGYRFVNWTNADGGVVGTALTYVPEKVGGLNVAATYTANFEIDDGQTYTINYLANIGGSVDPASETHQVLFIGANNGSTATAAPGYSFVSWSSDAAGQTVVSASANFVPAVNDNATFYANFDENENITINYVATTGGSVSLASESLAPATGVAQGSTATAAAGYSFVNWTDEDGDVVGTDLAFVPVKVGGVNVAATYTANFIENENITISYVATTGGSVSLESESLAPATGVAQGSTAAAAFGYKFVNWTNADGGAVGTALTFVPSKVGGLNVSATYTANFEIDPDQTYTINYVANNGGSVSPASETHQVLFMGANTGSTATPTPGYSFVSWTSDAAGLEVVNSAANATLVPTVHANATFYANFTENPDVTINYVATTGGSVSLESESLAPATGVAQGSTAAAAPGYSFVNWTNEDGIEVSAELSFVPEMVGGVNVAATYTANFAENENITISYVATTGGSVSPASESLAPATGVAQGSAAAAAFGYKFVNWTNADGDEVGTDLTFVPAKVGGLNVAATYTANFEIDPDQTYTINYVANNGGSVDPASETHQVLFTGANDGSAATAAPGYSFVSWTSDEAGQNVVSSSANFVPAVNDNATFYANFVENPDVAINYVATTGGSVSRDSESLAPATGVAQGSTAEAAPGYSFVNWTDEDGIEVSAELSFVPDKVGGLNVAATYTANFVENENITISYVATTGGSVSRESESLAPATGVAQGSTALAELGYKFVNWTGEDGEEVGTELQFVPEKAGGLNVAATYTANFAIDEEQTYTINYVASIGGSVDPASETHQILYRGDNDGSTATAALGYKFLSWTSDAEGENAVSTDPYFIPEINGDATFYANFVIDEEQTYTINYVASIGGSVDPASETHQILYRGANDGSTATAALGYKFLSWTSDAAGEDEVSTDPYFIPEINGDATFYANFVIDEEQTYTINYIANNGGSVDPASETHQILYSGENDGSTAAPRSGYRFRNWTRDAEGRDVVSTDRYFVPEANEDATFYANFTIIYTPATPPPTVIPEDPEEPENVPDEVLSQVDIPDVETPLVSFPEETEEDAFEEIDEGDVPMSAMPKTGIADISMILILGLLGSMVATGSTIIIVVRQRKKERE